MGATLYGVLGVESSADESDIHRAYRESVKTHHPDVSDDPDARAQFKRVRTAKEVLTDSDDRARYDRLGHETYVRRHLDAEAWGVSPTVDGVSSPGRESEESATTDRSSGPSAADEASGPTESTASRRQYRADGGTAAEYYRADPSVGVDHRDRFSGVSSAVVKIAPWLVVYLLLGLSTGTVAAMVVAGGTSGGLSTLVNAFVATAIVVVTASLSGWHLLSTLYR